MKVEKHSLTVATKKTKYVEKNLIQNGKYISEENFPVFLKEIEEDSNL